MTVVILITVLIATFWILHEIRENRRAAELREIHRPDWIPPRACPACNAPMHPTTRTREDPESSLEEILYCRRKECPAWLWPIYFKHEKIWKANPVVLPIISGVEAYRNSFRLTGSVAEAKKAAEKAAENAHAEHVAPLSEDEHASLNALRLLAQMDAAFFATGPDSEAALEDLQRRTDNVEKGIPNS